MMQRLVRLVSLPHGIVAQLFALTDPEWQCPRPTIVQFAHNGKVTIYNTSLTPFDFVHSQRVANYEYRLDSVSACCLAALLSKQNATFPTSNAPASSLVNASLRAGQQEQPAIAQGLTAC